MPRFVIERPGRPSRSPLTEFYREEFVKHHRWIQEQRDNLSSAADNIETALLRIISQVDNLSKKQDANQVVARLLREIDVVTKLSAWSDPHKVH